MNKKQLIVARIVMILLVIVFGLKTTTVYTTEEVFKLGGPTPEHIALRLYGNLLLDSSRAGSFYFLLNFGDYKYSLTIAIIVICGLLIYTLRDKKK